MKDPLVKLLDQPEIRDRLNTEEIDGRTARGVFQGLSGTTQIDFVIGVIETTLRKLPPGEPKERIEQEYQSLRADSRYTAYFPQGRSMTGEKPSAYKALHGF